MGKPRPMAEFDLFDPQPFIELPPLLARRLGPGAGGVEQGRGTVAGGLSQPDATPAAAPLCDPAAAAVSFLSDGTLTSIARLRAEQIVTYGHTPEADAARPLAQFLDHMLHEAHRYAVAAGDDHRARTGLANIEKRMLRLGGIAVAVLDRIAREKPE